MGGAAPEASKGGKRSLDATLNLVPYIDLMTTIITFLIMTAVWTQIATLRVQNASGGPQEEQPEKTPDDKPKPIIILVTDRAVKIQEEGGALEELPNVSTGYDFSGVKMKLEAFKKARPERQDIKLQSEDGVSYENLVKIIDITTGLDMKNIMLTPAAAGG